VYPPVLANFKFDLLILRQIHVCMYNTQKNASDTNIRLSRYLNADKIRCKK